MLNLIGEGLAKGTKKALQETAEEVGEKAAAKVAKKATKKTRADIFTDTLKTLKGKYGDVAGNKLIDMYDDGKKLSTLNDILSGRETQSPLLMYHAVSSDKLAQLADQVGNKMPNPSLQIIDPNVNTGGNFGDVILLGNKDMAYPAGRFGGIDTYKKPNIYGRDIFSRRRPLVHQLEDGDNYFYSKAGNAPMDRVFASPENISKEMNKYKVRGSEGIVGPGSVAAQVTPQFSSLSDVIRNAKRLQPKDTVKQATDEWTDAVFNAIDEMKAAQDSPSNLSYTEYMQAIQDLLGNKKAVQSGFTYLPKGEFYDSHFRNETARRELSKLAEMGEYLPTDYFELKANRPINMSEFSGAILPEDFGTRSWDEAEKKVLQFLEDNNIPIVDRYFVGADGSSDRSKEAIFKKLAQQDRLSTPYLMSVEPDFTPDYDTRMTIDKLRDSAKRIGSKDVAKVNKKTLPVGWKELEKRMDLNYMDDKIAKLAGKEKFRDVTLSDMNRILDDMGYGIDPELIKRDGIQTATYNALKDALDDEMAIDLQTKGGRAAADFLKARSGAVRGVMSSPEDFYFGNEGRAGYLDAELSDRLGIGRSNTPLSDDLNDYISKDAAGDYFATGIGLKPSELLRGENELSTLAHERLHSFQHTAGEYDPGVKQAYDELHDALAPYKMNEDQMKAYLEGNGKLADADTLGYYVNDREQEARMFQEFLERAGYTKTGKFTAPSRITGGKEFDEGIDTPFNQFLLKLRTLSKAGIALPAVGLALLLGENYNNKKKEG